MPHTRQHAKPRRGVILLVVVTMLTLFAAVGLAFVLYAESEATSSRIFRESKDTKFFDGPDAPEYFNQVLATLIYDADDDTGTYNAGRGHSFGRAIYGWNYQYEASTETPARYYGSTYGLNNVVPYNGFGLIQADSNNDGTPDKDILNYAQFAGNTMSGVPVTATPDAFIFDPERIKPRRANTTTATPDPPSTYVGKNVGYTYPDANHLYLGALSPDGKLLVQSFHRPEIANPADPANSLAPSNPNWINVDGRKVLMRPRPIDHRYSPNPTAIPPTEEFPPVTANADGTFTGDVDNLGTGKKDSIWVDFDLPVRTWKGKLYKPLAAVLVLDLDSRINLNVAGNMMGGDPSTAPAARPHASNQGWGPWEINPKYVMSLSATDAEKATEVAYLLGGNTNTGAVTTVGRYGRTRAAVAFDGSTQAGAGDNPRFYGQVDYDGNPLTNDYAADINFRRMLLPGGESNPMMMPTTKAPGYTPFPLFPPRFQNGLPAERTAHASLYNPSFATAQAWTDDDTSIGATENIAFGASELFFLNKEWRYPNDSSARSRIAKLAATNFNVSSGSIGTGLNHPRWMVTTLSHDIDRPALEFMVKDVTTYGLMLNADMNGLPTGGAYPSADDMTYPDAVTASVPTVGPAPTGATDLQVIDPTDPTKTGWRNIRAALGGVDVNRKMADYRANPAKPYGKLADGTFNITTATHLAAVSDRQRLATDIYDRLVVATGADKAAMNTGTPDMAPGYNTLRWLAQLSVNIVDYVDADDYNTPFPWNGETLFGFESPRLVLNEAYAQVNNAPGETATGMMPATMPFHVNFWVELHNPLNVADPTTNPMNTDLPEADRSDADGSFAGSARLADKLQNGDTDTDLTPIYKILVAEGTTINADTFRKVTNMAGTVNDADVKCGTVRYQPGTDYKNMAMNWDTMMMQTPLDAWVVRPARTTATDPMNPELDRYSTPARTNKGFYVIGPHEETTPLTPAPVGDPTMGLKYTAGTPATGLRYEAPVATDVTMLKDKDHTIVLQRLACPDIAPSADNPYVTVDFMDGIKPNDAVKQDNVGVHAAEVAIADRVAKGRKQPFAGLYLPTDPTNSQLVDQAPTTATGAAKHTMYRHNGTESTPQYTTPDTTLTFPFAWPTHLDRQVANALELLHVAVVSPAQFTHAFTPSDMTAHALMKVVLDEKSRMYRALEVLRPKSRTAHAPSGGKLAGRVNFNTLYPNSVSAGTPASWSAVFDPKTDTDATDRTHYFMNTDVDNAWNAFKASRDTASAMYKNGVFTGFGNPVKVSAAAKMMMMPPTPLPAVPSGLDGTVLRSSTSGGLGVTGGGHAYTQLEMARKAQNSMTTKSHAYAIWVTLGYFEVRDYVNGRPVLGKEVFDNVEGDLRNQFFSVIDAANMSIDPVDTDVTLKDGAFGTQRRAGGVPFFFALPAKTSTPGQSEMYLPNDTVTLTVPKTNPAMDATNELKVLYDGEVITVTAGMRLIVNPNRDPATLGTTPVAGTTPEMDLVTVTAVTGPTGGTGTIQFTVNRPHAPGTLVSNVILGNPGPQQTFQFNEAPYYGSVVRVAEQLK